MIDALAEDLVFMPVKFSRNELRHVSDISALGLTDSSTLIFKLYVALPKYPMSEVLIELSPIEGRSRPFGSDGTIFYEGADLVYNRKNGIIDSSLEYTKPTWKQDAMRMIVTQTGVYRLRKTIDGGTPTVSINETLSLEHVVKAGLSEEDYWLYADNFFTFFQDQERKFLTWQPSEKLINYAQEEYLSFLVNISPKPSEMRLRIQTLKRNGDVSAATTKMTLIDFAQYSVVMCPVGPSILELDLDVVRYEVWLSDENNERLSEVRTYWIDQRYRQHERYVLFVNSLGGWDTMRLLGHSSEILKVKQSFAERDRAGINAIEEPNFLMISTEGDAELTVSTGHFDRNVKQWLKYMDEILLSEHLFLITDKGHIPLRLTTTELVDHIDEKELVARSFTFVKGQKVENFSEMPFLENIGGRPLTWQGLSYGHILDAFGKRTGYMRPARLKKIYADDGTTYMPLTIKTNTPGDPDYIEGQLNPAIVVGSTPYPNAAISRLGSFFKSNCGVGLIGERATIIVAAGKYGGDNAYDANLLAEQEYTYLNTQAYADANGSCTSGSNDYSASVPTNFAKFRISEVGTTQYNYVVKINAAGTAFKGNAWWAYTPATADVYAAGTWDINLPTNWETARVWSIRIHGKNKRITVYRNGTQIFTGTNTSTSPGYKDYNIPGTDITSRSRIWIRIDPI